MYVLFRIHEASLGEDETSFGEDEASPR